MNSNQIFFKSCLSPYFVKNKLLRVIINGDTYDVASQKYICEDLFLIELKNFDKNNYNLEEDCNNVLYFVKHCPDSYMGQIPNKQIVKDLTRQVKFNHLNNCL